VAGNQVKADLEIMRGVAGKLANDYAQLQQSITTLQGQAEMHSATWSGEAKNAWNIAMENVNAAWLRLNGVLDEITGNISTSGGQYGETDSTNASGFRNVQATDITSALSR
jgi:WXG100 family type VII secretion target